MSSSPHPPFDVLVDFVEGLVTGDGRTSLDVHVRNCPECREAVRQLEATLGSLRSPEHDAPDTWVERAINRAVPRRMREPMHGSYSGDIVFDSHAQVVGGVRANLSADHQLVLASERYEVELAIAGSTDVAWPLTGQVFCVESVVAPVGGLKVTVLAREHPVESVRTTETGEFQFRTRPADEFQLRIAGDGWDVTSPPIAP